MEHHPETEPGVGSSDNINLEDMSIQDLVSVLRTAFLTEDFDSVEEVLVNRDMKLQTDILRLQEMVDLEKLTRFQAEEDLRNREELCEKGKRAQNNYEKLLKQVKKNTNLADRETIGELRKKNNELDDTNVVAQLRIRVGVLENDNNALRVKNSELEKSLEKYIIEALSDDVIPDSEHSDEESYGDYEPPSKRSKNAQGASSTSMKNINVVVPPTNVQKQIVTQRKAKRKTPATFDRFHFISLVHQERSKFLTNKEFWLERNFLLKWGKVSDIEGMIVYRRWVKLTSFAKEASITLAKEFFANAYQHPAKENGNNKNENDLNQYTSFVRGKKVPFDEKIINQLFGLENYKHCSFEARVAKGSNVDRQEVRTLYRSEVHWVRNEDGTLRNIRSSNLTPIAIAWVQFINDTLLPCSNVSVLTGKKLALLIAIIQGEPVNVGRLLANHLRITANCSSPTSYINHASLISKLCKRAGVYPEKNEEMVKPLMPITEKLIETCNITVDPHGKRTIGYNYQGATHPWRQFPPSISGWPNPTPEPTNPWGQISPSISGWPNPTSGPTNRWEQIPPSISGCPNPTPGPTNPWGQIPPSISGWPNPIPGPTNLRGQIPLSNSGWPNPTPGPTNPQGQIPPSNSGWPNPTPGPTNLRGQIPPSNSGRLN